MRPLATLLVLCLAACLPPDRSADEAALPDSGYVMQRVAGNALVVPEGFRVNVFAERLPAVRSLALRRDGAVFVTLRRDGQVVRLRDADGDGVAEDTATVVQGLRRPHGIAFRGDTLYVAEEHRVVRYDPPYGSPRVVVPDLPADGGHNSRTILFHDGALYVSIGSSCNLCEERDPRRAAVMRYDLDGSNGRLFATGLRNAVGLAVHPGTGRIWATNNDRDRLGDDLPPDRVNVLVEGGWYGWPQCYLPHVPNPEYQAERARCAEAIGPLIELPAHTAPLGLAFYTGSRFPARYHGDLFIALHGSWDRSFPIGYQVVRVPLEGGQPAGSWEPFVVGWQVGRRSWGRPVDLLVLPDGAMLITDDHGGRVFRITADQPSPQGP